MSIKNEFSKYANEYNNHNIIQQIIAKSLVRELKSKPKKILELGCGSGQVFSHISWPIEFYKGIDFSKEMCQLHPIGSNIEVKCFDFDTDEFLAEIKNDSYDIVLSSSALQWSKDLDKIVKNLSLITNEINAVLFTSNTFKTIQTITNSKSPILEEKQIKKAFSNYFYCEFETIMYKLEFENKKDLFNYIKKSGVSGGSNSLDFKNAKKLYKEYKLNYLEFEVIFVKTVSKVV
ncbi:methyltransferase domain-containing protein [Poseidonibacter lekithochrous]|uniref:methyltransferase domain-containing protein n=1 Tax=Poseidonibacter TaxID=2321187 RepID=UPI001C0865F4|nr:MULTISPECIES: methyltransferase domain-containing protein [Poseidonibacter]MBU3013727.1 methyltransferase domain-containing protein [Poseidonibacter lekithochrous]MDO6827024.1 methyltransferase domain-containing protein [Poseidonibacter sp. 1_MG-2023]